MQLFNSHACAYMYTVPNGVNTNKCNPRCEIRQCCDRNEVGDYECFCLQAKVNNPDEYVKRPCESMSFVVLELIVIIIIKLSIHVMSRLLRNCRNRYCVCP